MHTGADVLRDPRRRAGLVAGLAACDRLVLLGDLLELRHGPLHEALAAAREPLSEIGSALGPGGEVVILAGNHDHHLVGPWTWRRALDGPPRPLGLETAVDWTVGEPLAAVSAMLAPARVRASYPGVWLRSDIWATHGHYLDPHMTVPTIERLGTGLMRRVVGSPATGPAGAEDYEAVLAPLYDWLQAVAQGAAPGRGSGLQGGSVRGWRALAGSGGSGGSAPPGPGRRSVRDFIRRAVRRRAIGATWPLLVGALNRAGLGPLRREVSGPALRRSGLRAMEEVTARLGASAGYVIFGHTHRAGPLPADDPAEWRTRAGAQLINSGSWVYEPAFLGNDPAASPYRAGFAVAIDGDEPPRLINLLDPA
ncbi:MAG TPA: hypothetical protein VGH67_07560 [Solirubrobacteraceae bacterium]